MRQYTNEYGTTYAVREHKGSPALMCRVKDAPDWSLSGVLAAVQRDAITADDMQCVLDKYARAHGWQPLEEPAKTCLCETCTCTGCHEDCFGHCQGCGHPVDHCNSYQTGGEKRLRAEPASAEPPEIVDESSGSDDDCPPPNPTDAAPASRADAGAAEQSLSAAGPASLEPPLSASSAFDYSGLDDQTVRDLHLAEREVTTGKRMTEMGLRRMADGVAIAHDALCGTDATLCRNGDGTFIAPEKTFGRWCESIGLNRKAAERLLNVARLFDQSSPKEEKVLETLGPTLLYEAAKPSAPAELVQAVKDRDITTAKEFRELEAQLKAERAAREKAEKNASENERKITGLEESYRIAHKNEEFTLKNLKTAKAERDEAVKERDDARRQVTEAENRAAGAQKLAEQRGSENTELKAKIRDMENQPRDVAVVQPGEEQIEAWRKEGEDRASAALQDSVRKANQAKADAQRQVVALQDQLAAARPDADACQRTADTLYETTENLRLLLRTQLRQARLTPKDYGNVVAHVLQTADALRDTVRSCAPAGYDFDNEEDDDFE